MNMGRSSVIVLDEAHDGILSVTFHGRVGDDAFEVYLEGCRRFLQQGGGRVLMMDAMAAGLPSARQRARQVAWQRENAPLLASRLAGIAFAIGSPLVRHGLAALLWLSPPAQPHFVGSSSEEARAWARGEASRRGLDGNGSTV